MISRLLCGLSLIVSYAYALTAPALSVSDGTYTVIIDATGTVAYGGCPVPATCSTSASSVAPGSITWGGKVGNFTILTIVGVTKPAVGSGLDVSVQGVSTGSAGGTLTIKWADTGFNLGSATGGTISGGGVLSGTTLNFKGYIDGTNTLFGTSRLIGDLTFNSSPFSGTFSTSTNVPAPFSATEIVTMTMGANARGGGDFEFLLAFQTDSFIICRMTGGGVDTDLNWDHTLLSGQMVKNTKNIPDQIDRYTFGGQAGASTASPPQPSGE